MHVLSADQFSPDQLDVIFSQTVEKRQEFEDLILANIFLEPSTRTRLSFESAMHRLGGKVITVSHPDECSVSKGESIADTIRNTSQYANVLVFRSNEPISKFDINKLSSCPFINAGDGSNEHPTQALIDAYTILKRKGTLSGLKILVMGDLLYGRAAHSFIKIMSKYENEIYVHSPQTLKLPETRNWGVQECSDVPGSPKPSPKTILKDVDVIYMTRQQRERYANDDCGPPKIWQLTKEIAETMKEDAIILHPLPRTQELPGEMDDDPRSAYFEQSKNGVFVRAALLRCVFMI